MEKVNLAKASKFVEMALINPDAAGIDIGDTIHAVAVPPGRDVESVRTFGAFTCDLMEIVLWLKKCSIQTVAMESTGVYWKNLFNILVQNGFEVYLVNARHKQCIFDGKLSVGVLCDQQQIHR